MITKMLKVINKCEKLNYTIYRKEDTFIRTLKFVKANINIVYILNNKIYIGYGTISNIEDDIKNNIQNIQDIPLHRINYKNVKYVTMLNDNELDIFMDLLKYEQKVWGNIRISQSYAEWIANDLPLKLHYFNQCADWDYSVDSIYFETDNDTIHVNVCLDNYDTEEFIGYKIHFCNENIVEDLKTIAIFEGKRDKICYDDMLNITDV